MKKTARRAITLLIALIFSISLSAPAMGLSSARLSADILYTLGVVKGTGAGYELDRQMTRAEAVTLVIRLLGKESAALSGTWSHPFKDVPAWADKYVGYAYKNNITKGVSSVAFGSDNTVSANDYFTFLLRVLGYSDSAGDFEWSTASLSARSRGLGKGTYAAFTRGDIFEATLAALTTTMKGGAQTLAASLVASGTINAAVAHAVGVYGETKLTARQVSDKYSAAVFHASMYSSRANMTSGTAASTASGFFISSDGLAVMNYHSINGAACALATLSTGAQCEITRIIFSDPDNDVVVVRVSQTTLTGAKVSSFSYLSMGSSSTVYNGDVVYALGCPNGRQSTITNGIVSTSSRSVDGFTRPLIQNTAPISSGSSGGALINEYGFAVGVTTAYYSSSQGVNLAVRLDAVIAADLSVRGTALSAS